MRELRRSIKLMGMFGNKGNLAGTESLRNNPEPGETIHASLALQTQNPEITDVTKEMQPISSY